MARNVGTVISASLPCSERETLSALTWATRATSD
jgi:hypothetical protein